MADKRSQSKITGRELARLLDVSPATISNALNGHDERVSPETKRRILEAAKRYGYLPPKRAKKAKKASDTIVFVVLSENLNTWYLGNLSGIADVCRKRGFALVQILFPTWDQTYFDDVLRKTIPQVLSISAHQDTPS